jgi:hypothetical protein
MTESHIRDTPSLCMVAWDPGHLTNKPPSRNLRCNRNTWLSRKHHRKPSHVHSSSKNSTFPLHLSLSSRTMKRPWIWLTEQQPIIRNQSTSTSDITKYVILFKKERWKSATSQLSIKSPTSSPKLSVRNVTNTCSIDGYEEFVRLAISLQ